MSNSNYPAGCTDRHIEEAFGSYDDGEPEITEEELEADYLDELEEEAQSLPAPVFYELAAARPLAAPLAAEALSPDFCYCEEDRMCEPCAKALALRRYPWAMPAAAVHNGAGGGAAVSNVTKEAA